MMGVVEGLGFTIIAGLITYNIKRTDDVYHRLDTRLDALDNRITVIEISLPKRKIDRYYSPNSGIEL